MFVSQLFLAATTGLLGLSLSAPSPAAKPHAHKHRELITDYDDRLKSILPSDWNNSTPIRYGTNFTASPPADDDIKKRDAWVGPVRNPWGETCDWSANAEYGFAPNTFDFVYYDTDWIQLVNYYNTDGLWGGWILSDEVRANWDWNNFYLQDLRTILYVTNKWQNTYRFYEVLFQIHEVGWTWRDMNNGEECWQNEWNTVFGRRTLYQCYFACSALLW